MDELLKQYYKYKSELLKNYYKYDSPYDNIIFNELVQFMQNNYDFFYCLISNSENIELLILWNSKNQLSFIDKYKKILSILIYNNDDYYFEKIKKYYYTVKKPSIIIKYINYNNVPIYFTNDDN